MGKSTRIEHWRLAAQQGCIAAKNTLGKDKLQAVSNKIIQSFTAVEATTPPARADGRD